MTHHDGTKSTKVLRSCSWCPSHPPDEIDDRENILFLIVFSCFFVHFVVKMLFLGEKRNHLRVLRAFVVILLSPSLLLTPRS